MTTGITWTGTSGDDTKVGSDGDDALYGGTGDDTLTGSAGDNTLYGGEGDDIIGWFQNGDIIKFDDVPGVSEFSDLTVEESDVTNSDGEKTGTKVVITYGAGRDTITLNGLGLGDIGSADFAFADTSGKAARATTRSPISRMATRSSSTACPGWTISTI